MALKLAHERALEELASSLGISLPLREPHRFASFSLSQIDEFVGLALNLEGLSEEPGPDLPNRVKAIIVRHLSAGSPSSDA